MNDKGRREETGVMDGRESRESREEGRGRVLFEYWRVLEPNQFYMVLNS